KYMEEFFGENADRYRYMHLVDSFNFLPYGTIVDAFQHEVYANPDLTPAERNAVWKKLEETFRPYLSTDGIPYICEGTRWQYQQHIFESPFYYIDYCLAQTAALQFLFAMQDNYQDAFKRYCNLAKQGGTKPFSELLEEAGLNSPFKEGALSKLAERVAALEAKLEL
ncbi:MAG: M3 family oligoendopeptidase, partial [Clostridia bacterium]|nr:M3 family oligoendopeptidase [Clostridia bacterium]